MDQSSSAVPGATTPCLPAPSQQFGGTQQPGSNCCTPDAQQPLHYGAPRSNSSNGGSITTLTTATTTSGGESFTVLNGSANRNSSGSGSNNKQRCAGCASEFRSDRPGIQCTGSGQGCRRFFHQECSELLPDAFRAIVAEPRAEWICPECMCRQQTQLTFA
ncbi:unnamed protein product [Gongylonema pulchrum]|uniref:PHD-type domain-containing protein n=1 Tax=Gongylonema pulchrum TaxID=637853 RepID=A0A183EWP1_9BILA|nr:unnamed protein product [Gongylonema pulchrum]